MDAWDWSQEDSVLHCVGLGSTYGLINSLQVLLTYLLKSGPPTFFFKELFATFFNSGATHDGSKGDPDVPV